MELHELELKSWDLRRDIVDIIMAGGGGHIGGDMSVLNTLPVLYEACKYIGIKPDLYDPVEEQVKAYLRGE